MPKLLPSAKFLEDAEKLKSNAILRKKLSKALNFLESNPFHPGLHIERITTDKRAWSARVDLKHRLSFEPETHLPSGSPDWSASLILLRILEHDDLYKNPR